jgi:hypothetical protein
MNSVVGEGEEGGRAGLGEGEWGGLPGPPKSDGEDPPYRPNNAFSNQTPGLLRAFLVSITK